MHEAQVVAISVPSLPAAKSLAGGQAECILAGAGG